MYYNKASEGVEVSSVAHLQRLCEEIQSEVFSYYYLCIIIIYCLLLHRVHMLFINEENRDGESE